MDLPDDDEVHLWTIDLARTGDEFSELAAILSGDELRRAANMRIEASRRRFVITRGTLRILLAGYLGEPDPAEIGFAAGDHGKPRLVPDRLSFNVSHSGELALVAVAAEAAVGVDIELVRPRKDALRVARRYFAPDECERLRDTPSAEQTAAFYWYWAGKEAFVKATGRGIAAFLASFSVALDPLRLLHVGGSQQEAERWSLTAVDVGGSYAAAVVTAGLLERAPLRSFDPFAAASDSWRTRTAW